MTPQSPGARTIGVPWYRRRFVAGWFVLVAAVGLTAASVLAELEGSPECLVDGTCGPQPVRVVGFGLLAAIAIVAFWQPGSVRLLASVFLGTVVVSRFTEVEQAWWGDAAALAFVLLAWFLTRQRRTRVTGLADPPITGRERIARERPPSLVRTRWMMVAVLLVLLCAAGVGGYLLDRPQTAAEDGLAVAGLSGGLAVACVRHATRAGLTRRRFLRRPQPVRECSVLPLRFEMVVVTEPGSDAVLVVPTSIWEEAKLQRLWARAGTPDGCRATLYGKPDSGRWHAIEVGGRMVVARATSWAERRDASLREAVTLLRHLADALPDTEVGDTLRGTADRYAAEVGEPEEGEGPGD